MQSNDFPGSWTVGPPTLTPDPTPSNRMSARARKLAAAGLLSIGMLAGGVAAVSAGSVNLSGAPGVGRYVRWRIRRHLGRHRRPELRRLPEHVTPARPDHVTERAVARDGGESRRRCPATTGTIP